MSEKPSVPRASFIRRLLIEIEHWTAEGLIDADTESRLRARYPAVGPVDWRGRLVTVLGVMAATLLGLGVILFFAANWDAIPRYGKLALIIVIMAGTYAAGWFLRYEREYPKIGASVIFLGAILYGAAIFLVAQAFNIREHFPNGLLLWAGGILPLVLVVESPYILCLFTAVFCAWSGTETFAFHNFGPFPLIVILALVLPLAYYYRNRAAVAFGITAVAYFLFEGVAFQQLEHNGPIDLVGVAPVLGCLLWVAGDAHRRVRGTEQYAMLYQAPGLLLVLSMLYLFTFPGALAELGYHHMVIWSNSWFTIVSMSAMLALLLAGLWIVPGRLKGGVESLVEVGAAATLSAFFMIMTLSVLPGLGTGSARHAGAAAPGIVSNLMLFALVIGMIVHGYRRSRPLLINAGIAMFALAVGTRYVDWFWDMMPRSLFFIVGGAVLLGGGIMLEKQRRRLVAGAREEGP